MLQINTTVSLLGRAARPLIHFLLITSTRRHALFVALYEERGCAIARRDLQPLAAVAR